MYRFYAIVGVLLILQGCASTRYGSRFSVTLESDPPGATAYLIPQYVWDSNDGKAILKDADLLEKYRIRQSTTPVSLPVKGYNYVYLVILNGRSESIKIQPSRDKVRTYSIKIK